ncbi:ATP-binding protein [Candidatus Bathyarchaeota archaeon]|nr:ATP-binding protein [Candidatus Bathyarchaeota archaeon]
MLREDVERSNEWWFTGRVRSELAPPFKRYAFQRILEGLEERQILLVTGPRRVGKTTLLYQVIERLLERVPPNRILYFSFDESPVSPRDVLDFYERRVLMKPFEEVDRAYIFFDEIQYAENWPSILKRFYDLYPNLRFLVTGSSSLLLSKEALERLAGRFFTLRLRPLTFREFLELKGVKVYGIDIFSRRMEAYFHEYLKRSGFPEIVHWESEARVAEYIKNSVVDRVALRDIPAVFKTRDMALMDNLIKLILSSPGSIININSLSRIWGGNRIIISNYLKYLEISLIVKSLSNLRPSFLSSSRKLKKYYPVTTSLIYAYCRQIFESRFGMVLETYAVNALDAEYYYRDRRNEINIILKDGELLPIEVKETVSEEEVKKFLRMMKYFNVKRGIIISLNQEMKRGDVQVMPAYQIEFLQNITP